jgi:hypothetical protein
MNKKAYAAFRDHLKSSIDEYCALGLDNLKGWKVSCHAVFRILSRAEGTREVTDEYLQAVACKAVGCLIHSMGFNVIKNGMPSMAVCHPNSPWTFVLDYDSKTVVTAYPSKRITNSQYKRRKRELQCAA